MEGSSSIPRIDTSCHLDPTSGDTATFARRPKLSSQLARGRSSVMSGHSFEELADQAELEGSFVERLVELGAIEPAEDGERSSSVDVRRIRLLHAWEEAGLPAEGIMDLVRAGELSVAWLDTPVMMRARRLETTFDELCAETDVSLPSVQELYEAIGFAPPAGSDRIRDGDSQLVELVRRFLSVGAEEGPTLRLLRVYADSLRRIAKAEAELYESQIEEPLRRLGRGERELLEFGARFGDQVIASLERAIVDIYHRHREHIWIEHSINHAEIAMERAGLFEKVPKPPAICFVDLTGYTRMTEERGDEFAARLASSLATLVEDLSLARGGRPIRWLGDGGMFHFKDPSAAALTGLDMVESTPRTGLPPMHIGIHTGPVIFQDGDVYGRTVNLASRIASHATAGEVLVSQETVGRSSAAGVRFEPLGAVTLKGVADPMHLYRAFRD
jgi:adenylate cyclase